MRQSEDANAVANLADGSTLIIERWLPGPAERVWRYLTDSDLRRQWFAAGDMTLVTGAPLELVWRNDDLSDPDDPRPPEFGETQRMQSRVINVEPMRRLTIAWGKGDVEFTLYEDGGRVLLTITHRGLDDGAVLRSVAPGWRMHVDILFTELSGASRPSFWSGWKRLRALHDERMNQQG